MGEDPLCKSLATKDVPQKSCTDRIFRKMFDRGGPLSSSRQKVTETSYHGRKTNFRFESKKVAHFRRGTPEAVAFMGYAGFLDPHGGDPQSLGDLPHERLNRDRPARGEVDRVVPV